jgi:hypothetical protein
MNKENYNLSKTWKEVFAVQWSLSMLSSYVENYVKALRIDDLGC